MNAAALSRDELVVEHLPLARAIARKIFKRLPCNVDVDDLSQEAIIGLIDAADRFDPNKGASFTAFAYNRVRGHVIDFLRSNDSGTRQLRKHQRAIDAASATLSATLEREPSAGELAAQLGISTRRLSRLRELLDCSRPPQSFEDPLTVGKDDSITIEDTLASPRLTEDIYESHEQREQLRSAIKQLPRQERKCIELRLAGVSCDAIGTQLGVSGSRASQVIATAIVRLGTLIDD